MTNMTDKVIEYWIHVKDTPNSIIHVVLELSKQLHKEGKPHGSQVFSSVILKCCQGNYNEFCHNTKYKTKMKIRKIIGNTWYIKRNENRH